MRTIILMLAVLIAGCATTSGISKKVQVYSEESAFIAGCKTIVPIEATAMAVSYGKATERATLALTEQAAKVGADGVAILQVHNFGFGSSNVQGIAIKCFNNVAVSQ